ncbi:hypothetical protein WKI65_32330 [Streptomyces sp. MS1.AVA.3]|uniref:competence protein CoiA family protein n=1 Tax=Streptomyces decoyicus TaxID=249567 RepID=UPI0030BBCBBA
MANGVFHTGYGIKIELTHADLGHPDRPELLKEITQPVDQRDRELLECLEHHKRGVCRAEDEDRSPWMAIRRRTVDGRTTLLAAHLPVRQRPTAEESDKHKAMKERIARAADRHGLTAEVEARSTDGRVRNDILGTGHAERIGWEAQYSPITASTVRRRSQVAADLGILPLWVTNSDRAALINRAPWARVDDFSSKDIASPRTMLVRGGVRHLQSWKCSRTAERTCPANGTFCGQFHAHWELPALCLPQRPHTEVDQLVVTSADGEHVPMRIPSQRDPRSVTRVWVPADDRDEWRKIFGPDDSANQEPEAPDGELTFTEEALDSVCRYGEENKVFNDRRIRRDTADAAGLHTFSEVPPRLFKIPQPREQSLDVTPQQRQEAAVLYGCDAWLIGPCAGCGAAIHRYGPGSAHACRTCRARVSRRGRT